MVQHGHREHKRIRIWRSDANVRYDKTKKFLVYLVNYSPDLKRAGKNIFQQGRTVWNDRENI